MLKYQYYQNHFYRFSAIPMKIPMAFVIEVEKTLKIIKEILRRKNKAGDFTLDVKLYYKTVVIQIIWCWHLLLFCYQVFVTPWTAAHQAALSFTISWSLLKLMSIESVLPSNHLILCGPLFFLSSVFPSIRVFSSELALRIRWPKYGNFSFSTSPSSEY